MHTQLQFVSNTHTRTHRLLYAEHEGLDKMHDLYVKELHKQGRQEYGLEKRHFQRVWKALLLEGVTNHETSVSFEVEELKNRAKGFSICDICKYYQMLMLGTSDLARRATYQRRLNKHLAAVRDDREELARIQRLCIINKHHCGFFLDAADSAKFQIPTTTSTAKMMSQLWRIRQKLTCVQMFDARKSLYMFQTLPNVPTGGNLTATILTRMFNTGEFDECTDLYINIDGAGDNVCYTVLYMLVHILLCASAKKWKLRRIHLLRMKVGHTHNELDATFGVLSRHVYGKHARGDSRKNILSFAAFKGMCTGVYKDRLVLLEAIQQVYDYDTFLKNYRPRKADAGIKHHFAIDFEVRDAGVYVRSKAAIGAKTPWNDWVQMYPSLMDIRPHQPHAPDVCPPTLPNKHWDDFDTRVVPTLKKFYNGGMKHGISIPLDDKTEMMSILTDGPTEGAPPDWVDWSAPAGAQSDDDDDVVEDLISDSDDNDEYRPFLQLPKNPDGKRCRCGSDTHMTVNALACPMNPRYTVREPTVDDDEDNHVKVEDGGDVVDTSAVDTSASKKRPRQTADADADAADDVPVATATPAKKRRQRRKKGTSLKKNAEVEVLYEGKWWRARIKFKHRGKYAVIYNDENSCEEGGVTADRIREYVQ